MFFTVRVLKPWKRLPREVVSTYSLETFKVLFVGALSKLIYLKIFLLAAEMPVKGPFQPRLFCDSVTTATETHAWERKCEMWFMV